MLDFPNRLHIVLVHCFTIVFKGGNTRELFLNINQKSSKSDNSRQKHDLGNRKIHTWVGMGLHFWKKGKHSVVTPSVLYTAGTILGTIHLFCGHIYWFGNIISFPWSWVINIIRKSWFIYFYVRENSGLRKATFYVIEFAGLHTIDYSLFVFLILARSMPCLAPESFR